MNNEALDLMTEKHDQIEASTKQAGNRVHAQDNSKEMKMRKCLLPPHTFTPRAPAVTFQACMQRWGFAAPTASIRVK